MILFVCSMGKFRSRTGELLCLMGGVYAKSAGTAPDAESPITDSLLREASLVVCMEAEHKAALKPFSHYMAVPTVTLGIPDIYNRLDPELCDQLIYQLQFHDPEVALQMQKGYFLLKEHPEIQKACQSTLPSSKNMSVASNPAFSIFPQL